MGRIISHKFLIFDLIYIMNRIYKYSEYSN